MTARDGEPPAGVGALWLMRHGESAGNVAARLADENGAEMIDIEAARDMDVPLSDLGQQQSEALGRWLREQPAHLQPTVAVCSPYVRAVGTAQGVLAAAGLEQVPLRQDERLRERELGVLDRLTLRGVRARHPVEAERRERVGKFFHRPAAGESWADVALRMRSLLDAADRDHPGERVLVVTHEVCVRVARYVVEGLTEPELMALDRSRDVPNAGLTAYERDGAGALVATAYETSLPIEEQGAPATTAPDVPTAPR